MKLQRKDIEIKILPILKKYEVKKAAIFGSYATGRETDDSDVDILVELGEDKSLLDLSGLQIDISETIHKRADVLTYDAIYYRLKDRILAEQKVFYDKGSVNIS